MEYSHRPDLAPTQELLNEYKKRKGEWTAFESGFLKLMQQREVENNVDPTILDGACLLCSEDSPDHCHRRLVAEYLRGAWGELEIVHLR